MTTKLSKKHQSETENKKIPLPGYLHEFREALEDEIDTIRNSGQTTTILKGGHRIISRGNENWYQFKAQYMPALPADTPCKLTIGTQTYSVTVISVDTDTIILATDENIPVPVGYAELENGSIVLMERLIKRIETNANKDNPAGKRILEASKGQEFHIISETVPVWGVNETLNERQKKAVISSICNDITYIWGPPGTGKTQVISRIIQELYHNHRSVLLVSHTNVAVDGAIQKTYNSDKVFQPISDEQESPILRLGSSDVSEKSMLMEAHIKARGSKLFADKVTLQNELEKCTREYQERCIDQEIIRWITLDNGIADINTKLLAKNVCQQVFESIEKQYIEAKTKLEKAQRNCPDTKVVEQKKHQLDELRRELAVFENLLMKSQKRLSELNKNIDTANISLTKLDIIEKIKRDIATHLPIGEQQKLIKEKEEDISRKYAIITEKQRRIHDVQTIIESYENTGFLRKLSRKALYESAKSEFADLQAEIQLIKAKIEICQKSLNDYSKELSETQVLIEKLNDYHVDYDREYWCAQIAKYESEKKNLETEITKLEAKVSAFRKDIPILQSELDSLITANEPLKKAKKQYSEIESEYQRNKEQLEELSSNLSKKLANEIEKISFIYDGKGKSVEVIISELENLRILYIEKYKNYTLEIIEKKIHELENRISSTRSKISEIDDALEKIERTIISDISIIGTTLTKSYLNDDLQNRKFDTVILDEASLASVPAIWCACYLAEKNVVIVGDFLQLSPIVNSSSSIAKKWLGTDVFHVSGISEAIKKNKTPKNTVILTRQYRMEKEIADIANYLCYASYHSDLKSNDNNPDREKKRRQFFSWYNGKQTKHCVHLINTNSLGAWATGIKQGKKSGSRLNYYSALVSVNIAFMLLGNELEMQTWKDVKKQLPFILIVTPYRPQVELIKKAIILEYQNRGFSTNDIPEYIKVGTIFSFQGNEADVVIFDTVIDNPHFRNNLCMPDNETKDIMRLLNVAVTRARFMLYIVGNIKFMRQQASKYTLGRFLSYLIDDVGIEPCDVKKLFPRMNYIYEDKIYETEYVPKKHMICHTENFYEYFVHDIKHAKKRIVIYSPFMTQNRISYLLPYFDNAILNGVEIVVLTKPLTEDKSNGKKACVEILKNHGIKVLHRYHMHEKLIFIDTNIVWNGSLNCLSNNGQTMEIADRIECTDSDDESDVVAGFAKACELDNILKQVSEKDSFHCPICNFEMLLKDGNDGGFFWQCANPECEFSESTDENLVIDDGVLVCSKCGSGYKYERQETPRWVCTKNNKHYKKIRKCDLLLPKMQILIPNNELDKVYQYLSSNKEKKQS